MIARATLVRRSFPNSVLAPIFSTFLLDEKRYVVVVVDGKAHLRPVEVGVIQGGYVQVTKGLSEGDLLVVKGQYDVHEGEAVEVGEAPAEGAAG